MWGLVMLDINSQEINNIKYELEHFRVAYVDHVEKVLMKVDTLSDDIKHQVWNSNFFRFWAESVMIAVEEKKSMEVIHMFYQYDPLKRRDIYQNAIHVRMKAEDENIFSINHKIYESFPQSEWGSDVIYHGYTMMFQTFDPETHEVWVKDFLKAILFDMEQWAIMDGVDSTLQYLGHGRYSYVYQVGNYVLKVGNQRNLDASIVSGYISHPTLFKQIGDDCFIEVSNFSKNTSLEESAEIQVFEHLANDCIWWLDCRLDNVGKLVRGNFPRFTNLTSLGYQFLGIPKELSKSPKIGSYIVIDRDYIFSRKEYQTMEQIEEKTGMCFSDTYTSDVENSYQKRRSLR